MTRNLKSRKRCQIEVVSRELVIAATQEIPSTDFHCRSAFRSNIPPFSMNNLRKAMVCWLPNWSIFPIDKSSRKTIKRFPLIGTKLFFDRFSRSSSIERCTSIDFVREENVKFNFNRFSLNFSSFDRIVAVLLEPVRPKNKTAWSTVNIASSNHSQRKKIKFHFFIFKLCKTLSSIGRITSNWKEWIDLQQWEKHGASLERWKNLKFIGITQLFYGKNFTIQMLSALEVFYRIEWNFGFFFIWQENSSDRTRSISMEYYSTQNQWKHSTQHTRQLETCWIVRGWSSPVYSDAKNVRFHVISLSPTIVIVFE